MAKAKTQNNSGPWEKLFNQVNQVKQEEQVKQVNFLLLVEAAFYPQDSCWSVLILGNTSQNLLLICIKMKICALLNFWVHKLSRICTADISPVAEFIRYNNAVPTGPTTVHYWPLYWPLVTALLYLINSLHSDVPLLFELFLSGNYSNLNSRFFIDYFNPICWHFLL